MRGLGLSLICIVAAGCSASSLAGTTIAPRAPLTDVNPSSASHQQTIDPSQYRGMISAWYFGHST